MGSDIVEPKWIEVARAEIGAKETLGSKHNPRILEYHKSTLLSATTDEVPWCSSFVNWVLFQSGFKGVPRSAAARSWIGFGENIKDPKMGCIVVLSRGNSSISGHVGFYVGDGASGHVKILGGNQGDSVSIVEFPKSRIIACRWPVAGKGKKK